MAKSFTNLRNFYGVLTKNATTANLTTGDGLINDEHRHICSMRDWPWLHRLRTTLTVASTEFVGLPYDIDQIESVFITVSNRRYNLKPAPSRDFWDRLNETTDTSDSAEWFYVYDGKIGIYPRPATSSNVVSINGKVRVRDLNTADITSSTIATLANGSTALTVSAGLTAQMAGFFIRPTFSTSANTGDHQWYEIASVTNATTAVLVRPYGGNSISVGTATCTIAQLPLLPENFHDALVYGAAAVYWLNESEPAKSDRFQAMHDRIMKSLVNYSVTDTTMVIDDGDDRMIANPNLFINL